MSDVPSLVGSRRTFARALLIGLVWGIVAAAAVAAVMMFAATVASGTADTGTTLRLTLETAVWTALGASILAIVPIGPIACVASWLLYRRGVVVPWAYAVVGALSVVVTLALIIVASVESMRYPTPSNYAIIDENVFPVLVAGFAAIGAFSGFMAGRVIRRAAAA